MGKILYYVQYLLTRALAALVNLLPLGWAYALADRFGDAAYVLLKKKRDIALKNLRAAFGREKSEDEIRMLARQSFRNMGRLAVEFVRIPGMAPHIDRYLALKGGEHLWNALKEGRGAVVLVCHQGNWEYMGIRAMKEKFPMHAVGRPLKNAHMYEYIKRLRGFNGLGVINKAGALRGVLKLLKQNQIVCLVVDQRETQGGIEVDFFGRPALAGSFPALLAVKHGVPLIPVHFRRPETFRWEMEFYPPLAVPHTGHDKSDIRTVTQTIARVFEDSIRADPGSWLWMHNRWRLMNEPK